MLIKYNIWTLGAAKNPSAYGEGFDFWDPDSVYLSHRQDSVYPNNRQEMEYKNKRIETSLTLPPKSKMRKKEEKYLGYTSLDRNGKFSGDLCYELTYCSMGLTLNLFNDEKNSALYDLFQCI